MKMNRVLLSVGGFSYAMLHAALGFLWVAEYDDRSAAYASLAVYIVLAVSTMLLYRGIKLPVTQAIITAVGSLAIPVLAQSQLQSIHFTDYSTWYVLGVGTLLSALALRGYIWLAAAAMTIAAGEVLAWAQWQNFFATGLLGPIMLLLGTSVVTVGLKRAQQETDRYAQGNAESFAQIAAVRAAGEERSNLLRETLGRTQPILAAIAAGKPLSSDERQLARLTEAALRDEIRGRGLMSDLTRASIERARRRGVNVTVLDEGGLQSLDAEQVADLHQQIASALDSLTRGKVTIRSPKGESWAVTIAAFEDGSSAPQLWLRLTPR